MSIVWIDQIIQILYKLRIHKIKFQSIKLFESSTFQRWAENEHQRWSNRFLKMLCTDILFIIKCLVWYLLSPNWSTIWAAVTLWKSLKIQFPRHSGFESDEISTFVILPLCYTLTESIWWMDAISHFLPLYPISISS